MPLAVAAKETKKLGLSLARSIKARLEMPKPTAPQALACAMLKRNMLAPSSRAKVTRSPEASITTKPMGGSFFSIRQAIAPAMMVCAVASVRDCDMVDSKVG